MATWNTDNPKITNQILEDVADIEECLQELHDVIHAITNGTLGTTEPVNFELEGALVKDDSGNSLTFPTNNAGAAVFMVGDNGAGNNTMWMYLNAAPTGWKVSATGGDTVLAISGGSGDYNVNGGNPDTAASWEIDGLTADVHLHPAGTLAGSSHAHSVPVTGWSEGSGPTSGVMALRSTYEAQAAQNTGGAAVTITGSTANVGKMYDLDTA
jgi:hypothetical protein